MSADPSSPAALAAAGIVVRPQPGMAGNDCSVAAVRDEITEQFDRLAFLGSCAARMTGWSRVLSRSWCSPTPSGDPALPTAVG